MVCDGAFVASTVASFFMNGVCCVWQMHEEEERREAMRNDLRVEYQRQRLMDLELWEHQSAVQQEQRQQEQLYNKQLHSFAPVQSSQEERRRRLLATKLRLSKGGQVQEEGERNSRSGSSTSSSSQQRSRPSVTVAATSAVTNSKGFDHQAALDAHHRLPAGQRHAPIVPSRTWESHSLLDEEDDDEESEEGEEMQLVTNAERFVQEDSESFEEVAL